MTTRKGLCGGQYKPLKEKDITQIHETSLRVFAEVGVQVNYGEALEAFKSAGAQVDEERKVVKMPPDMVEEWVGKAPSTVRLCGRADSGQWDCELGGTRVYLGT
ncbi:MAG: hypothetical protein DRG63_03025 [Deltaproteobacteria bacterium]|nr:MAG: hypothetical protein DRG63_03025 [Deltaproteobacteria bacterium]